MITHFSSLIGKNLTSAVILNGQIVHYIIYHLLYIRNFKQNLVSFFIDYNISLSCINIRDKKIKFTHDSR